MTSTFAERRQADLEYAKKILGQILDKIQEDPQFTVLGIRAGRILIEARWDYYEDHCLDIRVEFPSWPAERAKEAEDSS